MHDTYLLTDLLTYYGYGTGCCICVGRTPLEQSPGGSTFLRKMTSNRKSDSVNRHVFIWRTVQSCQVSSQSDL